MRTAHDVFDGGPVVAACCELVDGGADETTALVRPALLGRKPAVAPTGGFVAGRLGLGAIHVSDHCEKVTWRRGSLVSVDERQAHDALRGGCRPRATRRRHTPCRRSH